MNTSKMVPLCELGLSLIQQSILIDREVAIDTRGLAGNAESIYSVLTLLRQAASGGPAQPSYWVEAEVASAVQKAIDYDLTEFIDAIGNWVNKPSHRKLAVIADKKHNGHWLWKVEGEPGYWEVVEDDDVCECSLRDSILASYQNPNWGFITEEKDVEPWLNTVLRQVEGL